MRTEEEIRRMLRITELSIKRIEKRSPDDPELVTMRTLLINQQHVLKWVLGDVSSNFVSDQAELDRLEERAAMEGIR